MMQPERPRLIVYFFAGAAGSGALAGIASALAGAAAGAAAAVAEAGPICGVTKLPFAFCSAM